MFDDKDSIKRKNNKKRDRNEFEKELEKSMRNGN